jgi:hypothetical protein
MRCSLEVAMPKSPKTNNGMGELTPIQQQLYLTLNGRPEHISVLSDDYERVLADTKLAAAPLKLKVFRLTATSGLIAYDTGEQAAKPSPNVAALFDSLLELKENAVIVAEDMHYFLTPQYPLVCARFREVTRQLSRNKTCTVMVMTVGPVRNLPESMKAATVLIDYPLPSPNEIDDLIERVAEKAKQSERTKVKLSPHAQGQLRNALRGITARGINTALAQGLSRTGELSESLLPHLFAERERIFQGTAGGTGAQFFTPPARFRMAGCDHFKRWTSRQARIVAQPDARVPLARGTVLLGPSGTGTTRLAFYFSAETGLPLITMSMSGLAGDGGGKLGAIPAAMRAIRAAAEACEPCVLLWDEIFKDVDDPANAKRGGGTVEYGRAIADFQTWAETRKGRIILFGTSNVNDLATSLPEGFLERFPVRWLTAKPDEKQRAEIFEIELEKRGYVILNFGLDELAGATDGWVGREIRDLLDEAEGLAFETNEPLHTGHIQEAITTIQANTEQINGWRFRRIEDTPSAEVTAADNSHFNLPLHEFQEA